MSRKLTSKCDGCGVEVVENDDAMPTGILGVMRRRHGSDRWGSLNVATGGFPATFDLCEKCTARVMALLELEMPKPDATARHLGGLGGHAMPFMPGDFMAPPSAPPWMPPTKLSDTPFGQLTPEDLKHLGIELPPGLMSTPIVCGNCGVTLAARGICPTCGHDN